MVDWEIPRTPASVSMLLRLAKDHGLTPETCLSDSRLTIRGMNRPGAEVTARQELTVIGNILEALDYPESLGIDAGYRYQLTTFGIFGFALISSPTLRSAIEVGIRYLDLSFAICHVSTREVGDEFQFVLEAPGIPHRIRRFELERTATAIRVLQREIAIHVPKVSARFTFAPPDNVDRHTEVFGSPPEFNAAENILALPADVLDVPLPQANEYTAAATQQQCRQILEERRSRTGLSGQVRDLLLARPSSPPNADQISGILAMSPRTLRHRLAAEGTSYRELLDEVRQRLAEEMLLTARLTVAETAQRLGYVELSSFSQAFRRWHGVGPRAYRTAHATA